MLCRSFMYLHSTYELHFGQTMQWNVWFLPRAATSQEWHMHSPGTDHTVVEWGTEEWPLWEKRAIIDNDRSFVMGTEIERLKSFYLSREQKSIRSSDEVTHTGRVRSRCWGSLWQRTTAREPHQTVEHKHINTLHICWGTCCVPSRKPWCCQTVASGWVCWSSNWAFQQQTVSTPQSR